ncbi:MAG TPA: hypothetical protein VK890_04565 [Bacteroidia bacterium]|jgi:hypothetical protein|nr:hypothetical protein [Bacteroidia bacterium]
MKPKIVFVFLFFLLAGHCFSQNISVEKDSVLRNIKRSLPNGWTISIVGDKLFIERTDSAYEVIGMIPDSVKKWGNNTPKQKMRQYAYTHEGNALKLSFSYRIETKWTIKKIKLAKLHNDSIQAVKKKLWADPEARRVFLPDSKTFVPTKGGDENYRFTSKEDSLKRAHYNTESQKLEDLKWPLPNKATEKYNLFDIITYVAPNGPIMSIYPESANAEYEQVSNLMYKYEIGN